MTVAKRIDADQSRDNYFAAVAAGMKPNVALLNTSHGM
jgi:hypothetical protein